MKILLVGIVVLIILGGVVFYFGWIQIQLPENTYAVIFTKTRGWDDEATVPGTFVWRWERLIPTNMRIFKYPIEPQSTSFRFSGTLPSGDLYASIMEPRPSFDYNVAYSISFTLRPDALVALARDEKITPDALSDHYEQLADSIATSATTILNSLAGREDAVSLLATSSPELEGILLDRVSPGFPEVDLHRLMPTELELPDVELYLTAKQQFLAIAQSRESSMIQQMQETVKTDTRVDQHFDVLERYGSLLSDYPVLLELFNMKEGRLDEILAEIEHLNFDAAQP